MQASARSGSSNWIHLIIILRKLCALYILSCHPKANKLLYATLRILLSLPRKTISAKQSLTLSYPLASEHSAHDAIAYQAASYTKSLRKLLQGADYFDSLSL